MPSNEQKGRKKLLILFFLSGATALIYQVVWTRLLTLFFGSTILAVSTVLATFMAGLAIGSALIGRKADTASQPVRFYAWLELFIGIFAIATPLIFSAIEHLYIVMYSAMLPGFWQAALLRFALSSLLLLPPTILMGGTLPVLSKVFLDSRNENTGRALSLLYFINTAGAVAGTLAAGLFLLQLMGVKLLLLLSGMINIGIFLFAFRTQVQTVCGSKEECAVSASASVSGWSANAVLAAGALFFSGLTALIYEVVWTRVLTLIIGSSTYAFTIMLATFLAGIAIGSAVISRLSSNKTEGIGLLSICQVLIGVFALVTASIFGVLPDAFISLFGAVGEKFTLFLTANFLLCFIVMAPATLFMGASFPVAGAVVVETFGSSGRRIGLLYAGNTIGAILGAFLAGFALLPSLGIHQTLVLTIILNLSVGFILAVIHLFKHGAVKHLAAAATAVSLIISLLFIWQPEWDKLKMTSGPYAYAIQYQKMSIDERLSKMEQLFYQEGPVATVSVIKEGERLRLLVDGKTDAGNFRDMTTQVLLGHLPLLIKPDAKDALIIGFASGITAGAVAQHSVSKIDCVEIEPAMKEASAFFWKENYHIADDRRFTLITDDARSYVLTTDKKYDLIISEPSNPWQAGSSRLFTQEFFLKARNILKKDGLMVQWMHLYGTDVESFRLVARTFMSVFPHATLWMDPVFADVIFIGSSDRLDINPLVINKIYIENTRVRNSMLRIGYSEDWSLMKAFQLEEEGLKRFAGTGDFNTDDLPLLEYNAPRALYSPTAMQDNLKALQDSKLPESFPKVMVSVGDEIQAASLLREWGKSLAAIKALPTAKGALLNSAALNPMDYQNYFLLAYLRMHSGNISGAVEYFEKALSLNPKAGSAYVHLGTLYYQGGDIDRAYAYMKKAILLGEDSAGLRNNIAVILAKKGDLKAAIEEVKAALSINPNDEVAKKNLNTFRNLLESKK
ncbi:MAG: fused MFS/spermidine synthase [Nitrospirae bacterium]|nr:fused MFS/spermidine synthase [Nitrospirota bacterium]